MMRDPAGIHGVEERVASLVIERARFGRVKYGVALGEAGLSRRALLRHTLEELLDAACYVQAAIDLESQDD